MVEGLPLKGIYIDNRRPENKTGDYSQIQTFCEKVIAGNEQFRRLTPELLQKFNLFVISGGDGTTQHVIDTKLRGSPQKNETSLVFVLVGGGTANTLLKGLKRGSRAEIPEHLQNLFSPDLYEARVYYPPQMQELISGKLRYLAYLCGTDHLTTFSQTWFEKHKITGKAHLSYTLAGIASAVALFQPKFKPIEPSEVTYRQNGEIYKRNGPRFGACLVAGVPKVATFDFQKQIEPDKVRLLTIEAEDKPQLAFKYAMALSVGAIFPHGPDIGIKLGLIQAQDVDEVSIHPQQSLPSSEANCVIDGEIRRINGPVNLRRSQEELIFILPRR